MQENSNKETFLKPFIHEAKMNTQLINIWNKLKQEKLQIRKLLGINENAGYNNGST